MNVDRLGRGLAIAAAVAIVAAIAMAVWVIGGPGQQRQVRLDERRVADLVRIARQVEAHVERSGMLPEDLGVLAAQPGLALQVADPVTGAPYLYARDGARRYRLCAVFATDTAAGPVAATRHGDEWSHGTGPHCFQRSVPQAAAGAAPPGQ
jgi:hypothetical protein